MTENGSNGTTAALWIWLVVVTVLAVVMLSWLWEPDQPEPAFEPINPPAVESDLADPDTVEPAE